MIIDQSLMLVGFEASSKEEVITKLSDLAEEKGYVDESYLDNVLKREEDYPTGLPAEVPVAIPHIGEGCKESFLGVATLLKPVTFQSMGGGDPLEVEHVFLIGVTDPQVQVSFLQRLSAAIQKAEFLEALSKADKPETLKKIIKDNLEA